MLGQSMNAIQKPDDARVCRYSGAAVFVWVFMFVIPNRRSGDFMVLLFNKHRGQF